MAKSILAGFVKGYTGRQLDLIDERRKKDAEKEKILMLEQLRRDTAEWEWTNDPGKKLQREEATQRMGLARTQEERAAATHGLDLRKREQDLRLDAAKTAADIEQSRAAAAYSRRAASNLGKSGGIDSASPGASNVFDVANELVDQFKGDVASAKAKGITDAQIMDLAIGATNTGLRSGASPQERILSAQERFRNALKNLAPVPEGDKKPKFITRGLGG